MVRCIPTFLILGLIASISFNHPIGIENIDEITETAGIQAFEDTDEIADVQAIGVEEDVVDNVGSQLIDIEEVTEVAEVQAVEDNEFPTDEPGIQAFIDEIIDIEIISDAAEEEPATTAAAVAAQPTDVVPEFQFDMMEDVEDLALDTIKKLKALNIIRSEFFHKLRSHHHHNKDKRRKKNKNKYRPHKVHSDNKSEEEIVGNIENLDDKSTNNIFNIKPENNEPELTPAIQNVETEAPTDMPVVPYIPTDILEEQTEAPEVEQESSNEEFTSYLGEIPTESFEKREIDDIEIALFEVESEPVNEEIETVTEFITEIHDIPANIEDDDEEQPTIGGMEDILEEDDDGVPLYGVVDEFEEDEVLIAINK